MLALAATISAHAAVASLVITQPDLNEARDVMRRKDGESVYFVHGSTLYTSLAGWKPRTRCWPAPARQVAS